jgi:oligosaccharyltransferase complex subunit alpha (ribophorin I)
MLRLSVLTLLVFAVLAFAVEVPSKDLEISATRTIDITSQIVKATTEYDIKNNGKSAINSFLHGISTDENAHLSWILANLEKRDGKKLKTEKVDVQGAPKSQTFYRIDLGTPLQAGATVKVVVRTEVTQSLKPYPATITQADNQFVLYNGNAHLESPYVLERQSTSVKVGSVKVVEFTQIESNKHQGDSIKYGPFNKVAAFSTVCSFKREYNLLFRSQLRFITKITPHFWLLLLWNDGLKYLIGAI